MSGESSVEREVRKRFWDRAVDMSWLNVGRTPVGPDEPVSGLDCANDQI